MIAPTSGAYDVTAGETATQTGEVFMAESGQIFGHLKVLADLGVAGGNRTYLCLCECGKEKKVLASNLVRGRTRSCGCKRSKYVSEKMRKHGHAQTAGRRPSPTYSSWGSMLNRCTNPANHSYKMYGGRGILVCERWLDFENFLADMGEKPAKGMSIERLDVNGNYEPGNCVWATPKIQARNTRRSRLTMEIARSIKSGELSIKDAVSMTGCAGSTASAARTGRNWRDA